MRQRGGLRPAVVGVAAVLAVVVAWRQSLGAWFVGDDFQEILRATGRGAEQGSLVLGRNLRPVTRWWLHLEWEVFGVEPAGYHWVSLALHLTCAALTGLLAAALLRDLAPRRGEVTRTAALAGGVFLLLANHTEAVSWIGAQADLLATAAGLGGLVLWLRSSRSFDAPWWGALAAIALALGAKESAVSVPLVIVALEAVRAHADGLRGASAIVRRVWRRAAGPVGILAAYGIARWVVLGSPVGSYADGQGLDLAPHRLALRLPALAARSLLPGMGPIGWAVVAAVAVAALVIVVGAHRRRTERPRPEPGATLRPVAVTAGTGLLLCLGPVLPLGVSLLDTQGERLVYLASSFGAVLVALAADPVLARLSTRVRRAAAVAAVVVAVAVVGAIDARWRAAGDLSEALFAAGPPWDQPATVVLLDVPDTLRGAYVARNSAGPMVELVHGWPDPTQVTELTSLRLGRADARIAVRRSGDRTWILDPGPDAELVPVADGIAWAIPGFTVHPATGESIEVTIAPEVDLADVWYVSEGELRPLPG